MYLGSRLASILLMLRQLSERGRIYYRPSFLPAYSTPTPLGHDLSRCFSFYSDPVVDPFQKSARQALLYTLLCITVLAINSVLDSRTILWHIRSTRSSPRCIRGYLLLCRSKSRRVVVSLAFPGTSPPYIQGLTDVTFASTITAH